VVKTVTRNVKGIEDEGKERAEPEKRSKRKERAQPERRTALTYIKNLIDSRL
jgi:hypothetical protein